MITHIGPDYDPRRRLLGVPRAQRHSSSSAQPEIRLRSKKTWAVLASLLLPVRLVAPFFASPPDVLSRQTLAQRFWRDKANPILSPLTEGLNVSSPPLRNAFIPATQRDAKENGPRSGRCRFKGRCRLSVRAPRYSACGCCSGIATTSTGGSIAWAWVRSAMADAMSP